MQLLTAKDQRFYAMVHQVLAANEQSNLGGDRRRAARHRYPCLQWLAPYREDALPDAHEFIHVQCQDISPGGFAFHDEADTQNWQASPQVVVALGVDQPLLMIAEIVRRRPVETPYGTRTLFGCRFMARIMDTDYRPALGN
jgi:hypothetical protein